jgi:DNA invertase Pin-like site-specific DNA recombinase
VVISIMAALAEQERISISERSKVGLARAQALRQGARQDATQWTWSQ